MIFSIFAFPSLLSLRAAWLAPVLLTLAVLLSSFSGCSPAVVVSEDGTVSDAMRPYVVSGVLAAINQSDAITAARVLEVVQTIRSTTDLNGVITADELMAAANLAINVNALPLSQQYLVTTMLLQVENLLRADGLNTSTMSVSADKLLTWVEEAARLDLNQ